jgi:hypothetical protein
VVGDLTLLIAWLRQTAIWWREGETLLERSIIKKMQRLFVFLGGGLHPAAVSLESAPQKAFHPRRRKGAGIFKAAYGQEKEETL